MVPSTVSIAIIHVGCIICYMITKPCKECGKPFSDERKDGHGRYSAKQFREHKYCSKECRIKGVHRYRYTFDRDKLSEFILISRKKKQYLVRFDEDETEKIKMFNWNIGSHGYAVAYNWLKGKKEPERVLMHKLIMGNAGKLTIDHINGNRLDNRKSNLRFITQSMNSFNTVVNIEEGNGVRKHKDGKYTAYIHINKKHHHLGYFCCYEDAVKCRLAVESVLGINKIKQQRKEL